MRTWALVWNPKRFDWEKHGFRSELKKCAADAYVNSDWSCGWTHATSPDGPKRGDRYFMFRSGSRRPGLIGSGHFLTRPSRRRGEFEGLPVAKIRFDYLVDYRSAKEFLSRDTLMLLTGDRLSYQASGMPVAPETAGRLELLLGMIRSARSRLGQLPGNRADEKG